MNNQKPSLPKGTRDFGPETMLRRNYIFNTIRSIFERYGFLPLETPAMEQLAVLTGKYGDEGDQLIFKILNSGNFLEGIEKSELEEGFKKITPKLAEKALRYDLTVPFARFVVMNRNEIAFPFKRYQIQPVWRADRPQKGRYREFFQCDADVVGTDSLLCETEIVLMIQEVFSRLSIKDYSIRINNRKILTALTEVAGVPGKETDLCVAIDKLDKIGKEKVKEELKEKGFPDSSLEKLLPVLELQGSNESKISTLENILKGSESGRKGLEEIAAIFRSIKKSGDSEEQLVFDLTLARGLGYYTGAIFEVKINGLQLGSVSGGGRYDNLTGVFGMPGVSGVGISFGVDRIYDAMVELNLFPSANVNLTKVLICCFDENALDYSLPLVQKLRKQGINSEVYPDIAKLKKQLEYANKKNIPYVIIIGSEEINSSLLTFKDMQQGLQEKLTAEDIIRKIS